MTENQVRNCYIQRNEVNTIWFWTRTPDADGLYRSFAVHHYQDNIDVSAGTREEESLKDLLYDYWGAEAGEKMLVHYQVPFNELPPEIQEAVLDAKVDAYD